MIGVAPPAAGSAAPLPAGARPAAARAAAPEPAPPAAAAVPRANRDIKRTMIGGLDAPAVLAAQQAAQSAPPAVSVPRLEAKPAPVTPWTVAITDDQHEEMATNEVVELFAAGTINAETFIWKEGMDDWQMPFDIPVIAMALNARGFGPGRAPAQPREIGRYTDEPSHDQQTAVAQSPFDRSDDQTVVTASPFDQSGQGSSASGVWREPGSWNEPPRAAGNDQHREVSFDDVTVSMAAPQAEELLRAAELAAALEKEDEPTAIFNAAAEASLMSADMTAPIPLAAPRPAAGQPARAAVVAREPAPSPEPAPARARLAFEEPDRPEPFEQPSPIAAAVQTAAPAARRSSDSSRPAARRAAATERRDLFGDAARAGGEEHHEEPAPSAGPRMTGQRNESSVLFSLDALVASDEPPARNPETRAREEDLLAPSPPARAPARAPARQEVPDSLMNVAGPAMFGNALAAPDFSAPVAEPPPPPPQAPEPTFEAAPVSAAPDAPPKSGGGAMIWVVLLLFVLLAAAVALVFYLRPELRPAALFGKPVATQAPLESTAAPPVAPAETAGVGATASAASDEVAAPLASGSAAAGLEKRDERRSEDDRDRKAEDRKREEKAEAEKAGEKPEAKPDEAKPSADLPQFDRAAAASALNGAAGSASSCKQADGPTGSGRATVTFAPSGRATNAVITGDFAGTAVGGCVARIFRGAKVPAFSGEPVTVAKSFSIN
jgi:hypothetical protein